MDKYRDARYVSRRPEQIVPMFFGVLAFALFFLIGNWITTNRVAAKLGYQPILGSRTFFHTYNPLSGLMWELSCLDRKYSACKVEPTRSELQQILRSEAPTFWTFTGLGGVALVVVSSAFRRSGKKQRVTTHGDARFSLWNEIRESGLVVGYVTQKMRAARSKARFLRNSGLLWLYSGTAEVPGLALSPFARIARRAKRVLSDVHHPRVGVTLGRYPDARRRWHRLRTDNAMPRGIITVGPPGSGKSSCIFMPSLVEWPYSAFIYDPSFELLLSTGEARRRILKNRVLVFAPTRPDLSCHINFIDAVKWERPQEIASLQNVVKLTLDPTDKAGEGQEAHWIATGSVLLECTLAFLHYTEPEKCNFAGAYNFLSDPRWADDLDVPDDGKKKTKPLTGVDKALKHMSETVLDTTPTYERGWRDEDGMPLRFHEHIRRSALMMNAKAPNEKSGVVSTTCRFLEPYRDPIIAELTRYSDFAWDDLMNFTDPVTLYFCVPPKDISRLRAIVRLALNLSTSEHMGDEAMDLETGDFRFRHPLAQFCDEFAQLGKQDQYMLALSMMRKYGILPILGVQDVSQIWSQFGGEMNESIMTAMQYKVFMRPGKPETAEWIAKKVLGTTTAENIMESRSGAQTALQSSVTVSRSYNAADLITSSTLQVLPDGKAIIKATDLHPFEVKLLHWSDDRRIARRIGHEENPSMLWNVHRAPDKLRPPRDWRREWERSGFVSRPADVTDESDTNPLHDAAHGSSNGVVPPRASVDAGVAPAQFDLGALLDAYIDNDAHGPHAGDIPPPDGTHVSGVDSGKNEELRRLAQATDSGVVAAEVASGSAVATLEPRTDADGASANNGTVTNEVVGARGSVRASRATVDDPTAQLSPASDSTIASLLDEFGIEDRSGEESSTGAGSPLGF